MSDLLGIRSTTSDFKALPISELGCDKLTDVWAVVEKGPKRLTEKLEESPDLCRTRSNLNDEVNYVILFSSDGRFVEVYRRVTGVPQEVATSGAFRWAHLPEGMGERYGWVVWYCLFTTPASDLKYLTIGRLTDVLHQHDLFISDSKRIGSHYTIQVRSVENQKPQVIPETEVL